MLRDRKFLSSVITLFIIASTTSSYAEEVIEDLIDIAESNSKIIAIIEGKKTVTYELQTNEKVIWSGSRGYLGAFLTNRNIFVISTSSGAWQVMPLKLGESEKGVASISPYIALLVTKGRAVAFDAISNRFIETLLPARDELLAAEVERYVAVVITSSRAFGLATKSAAFSEINLQMNESIEEIKVTYSKATIRSSERLLTFEASDMQWKEHRF